MNSGGHSATGRYVGLFLFGSFLFSFPVLTIFNRYVFVFGIPVLVFYLFSAWALLIFLAMLCTRRTHGTSPAKGEDGRDSFEG